MEQVLANLCLAHAPLAALIGNKIDWDVPPQGQALPCVVMFMISDAPDYANAGPTGLVQSRVQFDCRGTTAAKARAVADALTDRLSGYRGTFGGIKFDGMFQQSKRTRFDKDGAVEWFLNSRDFIIWSGLAA